VKKSSFNEGQGSSNDKHHEPRKANVGYQTGTKCKNKTQSSKKQVGQDNKKKEKNQ
jgi:hypothetical protein